MNTYTQLTIFETEEVKKVFKRDFIGQFASNNPTPEEILMRENFRLKNEIEDLKEKAEMWRRKHESLVKVINHKELV